MSLGKPSQKQTPSPIPNNYVNYQNSIQDTLSTQYSIASSAKAQGLDPSLIIESPLALDLADRVAKLLEIPIAERLRESAQDKSNRNGCADHGERGSLREVSNCPKVRVKPKRP